MLHALLHLVCVFEALAASPESPRPRAFKQRGPGG